MISPEALRELNINENLEQRLETDLKKAAQYGYYLNWKIPNQFVIKQDLIKDFISRLKEQGFEIEAMREYNEYFGHRVIERIQISWWPKKTS